VECIPSLHDYVVEMPCGIRVAIWVGLLYATVGKGSVSRNKDSSDNHVFDPKQ
jgi:hypothetical protein